MLASHYTALIVDDEAVLRSLVSRALAREGFSCDVAADGVEANQRLKENAYDVVVTDLRMPRQHGHGLICEILKGWRRPLVVVLTGVIEPRIAKDLLIRGVDDIVFKPVDYCSFAAKVKALIHRRSLVDRDPEIHDDANDSANDKTKPSEIDSKPINASGATAERLDVDSSTPSEAGLESIETEEFRPPVSATAQSLPMPSAALNVYRLANSDQIDARQLAGFISEHELLTHEVIRLANSQFYNRTRTKVIDLDRAVVQIGQKRIAPLALVANAITALVPENVAWLDVEAFWRRSIAAGLAIELLVAQGKHHPIEMGLLLCATMHSVGRLVLSSRFPMQFQAAVQQCLQQNEALSKHERRVFPFSQSEVMLAAMAGWGIRAEFTEPLRYVGDNYESIAALDEPLRSQAELVKLAALIGQIAVATWDPWDLVEIPPHDVLARLGLHNVATVIDQTNANVKGITAFQTQIGSATKPQPTHPSRRSYWTWPNTSFDFLAEVLRTLDVPLLPLANDGNCDDPLIVNCLDTPNDEAMAWLEAHSPSDVLVICADGNYNRIAQRNTAFALPNSISALRAALA